MAAPVICSCAAFLANVEDNEVVLVSSLKLAIDVVSDNPQEGANWDLQDKVAE